MIITDMVEVDSTFYCLLQDFNGIFRFCKENRKLELEVEFPDQTINFWLYNKMFVYEDKLVCIPDFASGIAVYNLQDKKLQMLPIKPPHVRDLFYDGNHKFKDGLIFENYIFMIGAKYPAIVRLDMQTYEMDYFDEWVNEMSFRDIYKESWRLFFRRSGAIENGYLYLAGNCAPVCLRLELCTMSHSWISICEKEYKHYNNCFAYGDMVWFMPVLHDSLIELDTKQNICNEYHLSDNYYENGKIILSEAVLLGNILFLLYQNENKVVLFNVETKRIEKIIFVQAAIEDECKGYGRYKFIKEINNQVLTYSRVLDSIIILNRDGEYQLWKLEFGYKYLFYLYSNHNIVQEQEKYQLRDFMDYIRV